MAEAIPTFDAMAEALAETAKSASVPLRPPLWVKPSWWALPLLATKTRPIPAASGWIDYITITPETGFAPSGYSMRIVGFVATGENDPLVTGMTYRFVRGASRLPVQEFDITNTIERHVERYSGVAAPWPAWGRKMFLNVINGQRLVLQVNNPDAAPQLAIAAIYGYFYPNLRDLGKGSLETGIGGNEESDRAL